MRHGYLYYFVLICAGSARCQQDSDIYCRRKKIRREERTWYSMVEESALRFALRQVGAKRHESRFRRRDQCIRDRLCSQSPSPPLPPPRPSLPFPSNSSLSARSWTDKSMINFGHPRVRI